MSQSAKVMHINAMELKKSFKSCKECFYIPYVFLDDDCFRALYPEWTEVRKNW